MFKVCLLYFVSLLLHVISGDVEYESEGGSSGNVKLFPHSKPLVNLIQNQTLPKTDLGMLACCPPEDAYLELNESSAPFLKHTTSLKPYFATNTNSHLPIDFEIQFQFHRNFGKISAFAKCSLNVKRIVLFLKIIIDSSAKEMKFLSGAMVITKRHLLTSAQCAKLAECMVCLRVALAEHDIAKDPDCLYPSRLGCSTADVVDADLEQIYIHNAFNFTTAGNEAIFERDISMLSRWNDPTFDRKVTYNSIVPSNR